MGLQQRAGQVRALFLAALCAGLLLIGAGFGAAAAAGLPTDYREYIASRISDGRVAVSGTESPLLGRALAGQLRSGLTIAAAGMTVFAAPAVPVILFGRGFVAGFAAGLFTGQFGIVGVLLSLASLFPPGVLWIPALVGLGTVSLSCALTLIGRRPGDRETRAHLANYAVVSGCCVILLCGAAVIEALVCPLFLRMALSLVSG